MSPDLESFVEELRAFRDLRGAEYQIGWDRYAAATENALRQVDKTADFDADTLEKVDEIRAIIRRKAQSVQERLDACQLILDALGILTEEKRRITGEQLRKMRR